MRKHHSTGREARPGRRRKISVPDLRQYLLGRRQELLGSVRREWRDLQPPSTHTSIESPGDIGGLACLTLETEMTYELMGSRAQTLKEIDRALEKIDTGSYGHCEDCDEPILPPRLRALLFAIRCTACQESLERSAVTANARPSRW